ncbi:2OG-Fe(II) oxygenase family protein [Thalassotalea litorea]|uniref:2OG-Fe(II) oxygenase n=1 Tax=Thalassotalea litorea TaxID=2020715 RepID=UPI0037350F26
MSFLSKLFRWERGRQKSGYDKMLLCGATWPITFDLYLLKFPLGSEIAPHTDKVDSGQHYRLNIVLKNADEGGVFSCENAIFQTRRIKLFRPDNSEHQVSKIKKGSRYLLSIGWVRKPNTDQPSPVKKP